MVIDRFPLPWDPRADNLLNIPDVQERHFRACLTVCILYISLEKGHSLWLFQPVYIFRRLHLHPWGSRQTASSYGYVLKHISERTGCLPTQWTGRKPAWGSILSRRWQNFMGWSPISI